MWRIGSGIQYMPMVIQLKIKLLCGSGRYRVHLKSFVDYNSLHKLCSSCVKQHTC